ncbi:hypothetical protein T459_17666 [Capsicum annuum]|uniref:Uncharacterized protein n=1 Tax=Capsicum annuum TaxID=4072 RepID=A0A2G2ZCE1_CAPAN|nr:putative protein TRANSPARENT TESTA GLABRA 1-like [Capsicum annuum]PHT79614.1 hypothetical protein T459_17666 [Capsicum annuum]
MSTGQCSLDIQRRLKAYNLQEYEADSDKQLCGHATDYNSDTRGPMTRPQSFAPLSCGEPRPAEFGLPFSSAESDASLYTSERYQSPGSGTPWESSCQANPFLMLNCESRSSQQLHSQSDQNNSDSTDYNEGKRGHNSEPTPDCQRFPSATDQTTNSICCNGDLNHAHLSYGSNGNITLPLSKTPAEYRKEESFHAPDGNSHRSQREAALTKFRMKRKDKML